jgi:hypothetical protein
MPEEVEPGEAGLLVRPQAQAGVGQGGRFRRGLGAQGGKDRLGARRGQDLDPIAEEGDDPDQFGHGKAWHCVGGLLVERAQVDGIIAGGIEQLAGHFAVTTLACKKV